VAGIAAVAVAVSMALGGCGHSSPPAPLPPAADVTLSCTNGDLPSGSAIDYGTVPGSASPLVAFKQRAKSDGLPTTGWVPDPDPSGNPVAYVRRSGSHIVDIIFVTQASFVPGGPSGWRATGTDECQPPAPPVS